MDSKKRRFIEETFPVKEVSIASAREKHIRHCHISTLHIWWARRPLASSRATNYAALIPAPDNIEEWDRKRQFIIDFSKWENSLNPALIEQGDWGELSGTKRKNLLLEDVKKWGNWVLQEAKQEIGRSWR